jgi:hypothetical protein
MGIRHFSADAARRLSTLPLAAKAERRSRANNDLRRKLSIGAACLPAWSDIISCAAQKTRIP